VMHVHVFRHGEGALGSVGLASADDRELANVVDPFLNDDTWRAFEKIPEILGVLGFMWSVELDLAFAIVTEGGCLDHAREADRVDRGLQTFGGVGIFEWHAGAGCSL